MTTVSTTAWSGRTARLPPSSTGRSPPWAIRWPISPYALNQWPDPTDREPPPPEGATAPPGFPARTELAARYAERTGRDLSLLDYYVGFNRWKTAAIVHGVYARYCEGKKSTDGIDLEEMRERIGRSLDLSEEAVKSPQSGTVSPAVGLSPGRIRSPDP